MMSFREKIARVLAPGLRSDEEIREMVAVEVAGEVRRAKMAVPITASYDPNNEGYRKTGAEPVTRRDLTPITQDRMFEVAYYMWDASPMLKRMATIDKTFIFGEPFTVQSDDPEVQGVIDRFLKHRENKMALRFPRKCLWLSVLGEQLWPVDVNPVNGFIRMRYIDPAQIKEVYVNPRNVEQVWMVELKGRMGRPGEKYTIIREEADPRKKEFGRLVGNAFFMAINNPPNSPRGRSDYLTLFDWIDSMERYGFNYLERAEFLLNFIWDVLLKGMDEEEIRKWLRDNQAPQPGAMRAHNEQVEWKAVAPDLKAADMTQGFEMAKSFIMGSAGRPASWYGEGGKAYQTEAELFGAVPYKDLDDRQREYTDLLNDVIQFVVDQAVIHGRLSEKQAEAGFSVNMPEISKKDFTKIMNGLPQITTALSIAVSERFITADEATKLFAYAATYLGYEIDAQEMIDAAKSAPDDGGTDYDKLLG